MNNPINLVKDTIDNKDIDLLIDWLKTYPRLIDMPTLLFLVHILYHNKNIYVVHATI